MNRGGNRPSSERASERLDQAVELCRRSGFKKVTLRGDTDFSQTKHLDRWDEQEVEFVFGMPAMKNLVEEDRGQAFPVGPGIGLNGVRSMR